ncbi:MAG: DUF3857 and transglutaminase domain-containing protein [Verrucomicrobiota bacterium]
MNLISKKAARFLLIALFFFFGFHCPAQFIPQHADVVLVAGMAGDLETEKEYRDQLHSWLELLAGQKFTGAVAVLADVEPEEVPANLPVKKFKATREEFLGLTKTLAGSTNPLLVVAWGHGGLQGRTPVFHVRGPRLTPADFKTLAASTTAASDWILFFRGSGKFAQELAASERRIISSENETIYGSDPVGLSILLKKLKSDSTLNFVKAGHELGSGVASWYHERNLARTEEPTLWLGTEKPAALVATDSETNTVPGAKPQSAFPKDLPAAWKEIQHVEARKYPDADAVVLNRRQIYTLGNHPALSVEEEQFIQVLTEEGKRFGDFDFNYSPPFEDMNFLDCEVLRPGGDLVRLDPEAIRETSDTALADYKTGRRKFFSLPQVSPGSILHLHYTRTWQSFPLPHVSTKIPLAEESPVLEETIRVSVPRTATFHFSLANLEARDPQLKQTEYGTTYTWNFKNLDAQTREALAPRDSEPQILISTFPDWADFTGWYARICKLSDEITPEIAATAAGLTRNCKSDQEKIAALYNYVTGLRYVAVEMGVNSFRPHAAANVLQNQFGDCKDKANLFNTLVRSLQNEKLDARLVLVPRFTQADEATPGLAFNHAISRVKLGDEVFWIDTTDDICRFGMLPPGDPGRKVLVIDEQTRALAQLPKPPARDHRLTLHATVKCPSATENELPMAVEISSLGYVDYELRSLARHFKTRAANVPLLGAKFRMPNASFILDRQNYSPISALSENFNLRMEGKILGANSFLPAQKTLALSALFWIPTEWEVALHHRSAGLFLNEGYPISLEETVEFELPFDHKSISLPPSRENQEAPLKWKIDWQSGGTNLTARFHAELDTGEISASEVPAFQEQIRRLFSALAAGAAIELP